MIKKNERENKELCNNLSLARKEIQEQNKEKERILRENENYLLILAETELELHKSKSRNEYLSVNAEKLKDKTNTCKFQLNEGRSFHQTVGIQTELISSHVDSNPSTRISL